MRTGDVARASLRARLAAHAVMRQCLVEQAAAGTRVPFARLFGADPLHPNAALWFNRALAELEVADVLTRLGDDYTTLHAVPVADGTAIDHLVIGPAGIFTISTKNHTGYRVLASGQQVLVNGHPTDYIRESQQQARRAADLLRRASGGVVTVTPLIVIVGVEVVASDAKPSSVPVLPVSRLAGLPQASAA